MACLGVAYNSQRKVRLVEVKEASEKERTGGDGDRSRYAPGPEFHPLPYRVHDPLQNIQVASSTIWHGQA